MTIPYYHQALMSLDTETTGVNPFHCAVVTCNITYDYPDGRDQYICDWLINPGIPIPQGASEVHGITTEYAEAYGMPPEVGLTSIAEHLMRWEEQNLPLVVFNASYDITLLIEEFKRNNIYCNCKFDNVIDPLVLDKQLDKYRKGKRKLVDMSKHYGVTLNNAHSADADSSASVQIARILGQTFKIDSPLEEVFQKQKEFKYEQAESLEKYFRKENPKAVVSREWPYMTVDVQEEE